MISALLTGEIKPYILDILSIIKLNNVNKLTCHYIITVFCNSEIETTWAQTFA